MTKDEYWYHISFHKVEKARDYITDKKIRNMANKLISVQKERYAINKSMPNTQTIAKICWSIKLHPSSIVTFYDYEIVDKYWEKKPKLRNNCVGDVTYLPLRELLYDRYGSKEWKKMFKKLCDICPTPEQSEEYYERQQKLMDKLYGEGKVAIKKDNVGLSEKTRANLMNDRPVPMYVIYEICRILHCPIDCVMGYK